MPPARMEADRPGGGLSRVRRAVRAAVPWLGGLAAAALFLHALRSTEFEAALLGRSWRALGDLLGRAWPPVWEGWPSLLASLWETILMAYAGTVIGAVVSLPLGALATRGVLPWPATTAMRLLLNAWRTVPSIVWALVFVVIAGLGPMPGVLALAAYSAGYLTKFYYEAFEATDPAVRRALAGVGASGIQVFLCATLPEARPALIGQTIYVFEYNVRAAAILGVVGAGGIGTYLHVFLTNFQYREATACLLLLLVVVTALDAASTALRRRLVEA